LKKPAAIIPTSGNSSSQPMPSNAQTFQPQPNNSYQPPPVYTPSSAQSKQPLNLTDIEKQQQELDRRAAELDRREQLMNTPLGGGE